MFLFDSMLPCCSLVLYYYNLQLLVVHTRCCNIQVDLTQTVRIRLSLQGRVDRCHLNASRSARRPPGLDVGVTRGRYRHCVFPSRTRTEENLFEFLCSSHSLIFISVCVVNEKKQSAEGSRKVKPMNLISVDTVSKYSSSSD